MAFVGLGAGPPPRYRSVQFHTPTNVFFGDPDGFGATQKPTGDPPLMYASAGAITSEMYLQFLQNAGYTDWYNYFSEHPGKLKQYVNQELKEVAQAARKADIAAKQAAKKAKQELKKAQAEAEREANEAARKAEVAAREAERLAAEADRKADKESIKAAQEAARKAKQEAANAAKLARQAAKQKQTGDDILKEIEDFTLDEDGHAVLPGKKKSTPTTTNGQVIEPPPGYQEAGFNWASGWPILGVIGIGLLLVLKGKKGSSEDKGYEREYKREYEDEGDQGDQG